MAEKVIHTETRRAGLGCFGVIVVLVGAFFIVKNQREKLDLRIDSLETEISRLQDKIDRQQTLLTGIALEVGSEVEIGLPESAAD